MGDSLHLLCLQPPEDHSFLRVLVVDDYADAAESLRILLDLWGHEARVCPSGPAALAQVASDPPDVVLVELALLGMDGYEVARRLRVGAGPEKLTLIAVTTQGRAADRQQAREAGFDLHLLKPLDLDELQTVLGKLACEKGGGASGPPLKGPHGPLVSCTDTARSRPD